MDTKRLFSSRRSLPVLFGAVALTVGTLLMLQKGNQALDRVAANGGRTDEADEREHRELVTVRLDSRWKLGHTSWGQSAPLPRELPPDTGEEPHPLAEAFDGLDVAGPGR